MACDLLATDIDNCGAIIPKGFEREGLLINKSDIDSYVLSGGITSSIILKAGKKGYILTDISKDPFKDFKITGEEKDYGIVFKKDAVLKVLGNTAAVGVQVNALSKNEYVLILKQKGIQDASKFVVVGLDSSLVAGVPEYSTEMGGWKIPMVETQITYPTNFMYVTSISATKDLYDTLLVA